MSENVHYARPHDGLSADAHSYLGTVGQAVPPPRNRQQNSRRDASLLLFGFLPPRPFARPRSRRARRPTGRSRRHAVLERPPPFGVVLRHSLLRRRHAYPEPPPAVRSVGLHHQPRRRPSDFRRRLVVFLARAHPQSNPLRQTFRHPAGRRDSARRLRAVASILTGRALSLAASK